MTRPIIFSFGQPGQFGHLVVHVGVAPLPVQRGKSVADAGQNGFAFLDQVAHGKLMAARAQRHLDRADQGKAAEGARDESHIRIRTKQIEDAIVRLFRLASAGQHEQGRSDQGGCSCRSREPRNRRAEKASSANSSASV